MSKLMSLYEQRLLGIKNRILKDLKDLNIESTKQNQIGDFIFYYSKDSSYFSLSYADVDVSLMRGITGYQMELKFENYHAWSTFLFSRWMDEIEETILLILKHKRAN